MVEVERFDKVARRTLSIAHGGHGLFPAGRTRTVSLSPAAEQNASLPPAARSLRRGSRTHTRPPTALPLRSAKAKVDMSTIPHQLKLKTKKTARLSLRHMIIPRPKDRRMKGWRGGGNRLRSSAKAPCRQFKQINIRYICFKRCFTALGGKKRQCCVVCTGEEEEVLVGKVERRRKKAAPLQTHCHAAGTLTSNA